MEFANTLVVLVGAPRATFEDLFGEGFAMLCFTVPSVREVANVVSELNVCARVQAICQGVRCPVCRGGVYPFFFLRLSGVCGVPPSMWFKYVSVMFYVLRTTDVGFVVRVGSELHREVTGSKAILAR